MERLMGAPRVPLPFPQIRSSSRASCRYKYAGANATDASGLKDTVEFLNVAKDDALAYPEVAYRTYPETVNARMESAIKPFVRQSVAVNNTVLDIFNAKLGLPKGALADLHNQPSGSEARCIKNPPKHELDPAAQNLKVALGAHTDFGSLVCFPLHRLLRSRT